MTTRALHGHTVVVGLGESGVSALRYLHDAGISVAAVDSRASLPGIDALRRSFPGVDMRLGPFDATYLLLSLIHI